MNIPSGASGTNFSGIERTEPIKGVVNFAMYKNEEPEDVKVLVFGDTQVRDNKEISYLQQDIIITHIPYAGSTAWADENERERFFSVLAEHPVSMTLAAHTHIHYHQILDSLNGFPGETPHHMVNMGTAGGNWWSGAPLGSVPWRPLGTTSPSKHLWEARIDLGKLEPGVHLIEVSTTDIWWSYKGYRQILIGN